MQRHSCAFARLCRCLLKTSVNVNRSLEHPWATKDLAKFPGKLRCWALCLFAVCSLRKPLLNTSKNVQRRTADIAWGLDRPVLGSICWSDPHWCHAAERAGAQIVSLHWNSWRARECRCSAMALNCPVSKKHWRRSEAGLVRCFPCWEAFLRLKNYSARGAKECRRFHVGQRHILKSAMVKSKVRCLPCIAPLVGGSWPSKKVCPLTCSAAFRQCYSGEAFHMHTHTLDKNGSLYDPAGTESWNMQIRQEPN